MFSESMFLFNSAFDGDDVVNAIYVLKQNAIKQKKDADEYVHYFAASLADNHKKVASNTALPEEANKYNWECDKWGLCRIGCEAEQFGHDQGDQKHGDREQQRGGKPWSSGYPVVVKRTPQKLFDGCHAHISSGKYQGCGYWRKGDDRDENYGHVWCENVAFGCQK